MEHRDTEIPYGHVRVRCNACNAVYHVTAKELKRKTDESKGFFPCTKCGSHATIWDFRPQD